MKSANLREHSGEALRLRPITLSGSTTTGLKMSVDMKTSGQVHLTALRASLSEEFAAQTTRLKHLTSIADPSEAHNRAALLVATRQSLEQISGALRRIAEGTYGICEECDAPIPPERLEVLPQARFCVPCQQKHHG